MEVKLHSLFAPQGDTMILFAIRSDGTGCVTHNENGQNLNTGCGYTMPFEYNVRYPLSLLRNEWVYLRKNCWKTSEERCTIAT
jgi:hypothetical protein